MDAIESFPKPTFVTTGDASANLEAFVRLQVDTFTHETNRLPGLLVAMRASDAIAEAVRNDITREKSTSLSTIYSSEPTCRQQSRSNSPNSSPRF